MAKSRKALKPDRTKYELSMTAWYLNPSRIAQLLDTPDLVQLLPVLKATPGPTGIFTEAGIAQSAYKRAIEKWLAVNDVPSMGELISKQRLKTGQIFTIYHDFYCKGLAQFNSSLNEIPRNAVAEIHHTLRYDGETRLRISYHPGNLTSMTAWSKLSGHERLFSFAYIDTLTKNEIHARPYIIADLNTPFLAESPDIWDSSNYGEIYPSQIQQFSGIQDIQEKEKSFPDLSPLKAIPESKIKQAIAEILHEGAVPADWGGERSDLFSTNVILDGQNISTAFLLKGPSRFSPMKMTHLGKNGDQIDRLFSEPADLLVLQHCHEVTSPVRSTMRAYAARCYDLRRFSILDGYDTIRLLKANKKCGF